MSTAKKFSLPVAAALAAVVLSAPSFAEEYLSVSMDEAHISDGVSAQPEPDLWLALVGFVTSIL